LNDEMLRRFMRRLTCNDDVYQDLVEKTWLVVYQRFKTEQFFKEGLLKRKAWQVFMDHCRATNTRAFVEFTDDPDKYSPVYQWKNKEGTESEEAFEARFWERFLPLEFDPTDRQMFMLRERFGYTNEEVAAKVGLPVSTVFDRIEKLRRAAKEQLEKDI